MTDADKQLGIEICQRWPVDLADVQGIIEYVRSTLKQSEITGSSRFSDFIRNATPEEKESVYADVMKRATERQNAGVALSQPVRIICQAGQSTPVYPCQCGALTADQCATHSAAAAIDEAFLADLEKRTRQPWGPKLIERDEVLRLIAMARGSPSASVCISPLVNDGLIKALRDEALGIRRHGGPQASADLLAAAAKVLESVVEPLQCEDCWRMVVPADSSSKDKP